MLAWRYFQSKRHHPFINVIRRISIVGVTLGVAALIVVLAVMNGFEKDLTDRIMGIYAHASLEGEGEFAFTPELEELIRQSSSSLIALSPYVYGQALLEKGKSIEGVLLKGAEGQSELETSAIGAYIQVGRYPQEGAAEIMIGDALADRFRLGVQDEMRIVSSERNQPVTVRISGIYHSGMYEYDAHLVYAPKAFSQQLFGLGKNVSGVALRFTKPEFAPAEKKTLQIALGYPFFVRTWAEMNRNLFGALKLEKTVMFIILTLIVMVACFNIVGTLTLLVIDKTKDIGILKSIGVSNNQVMRIFTLNGLLIGLWGIFFGLALGLGVCFLLDRYPLIEIPSDIYYFSRLPVEVHWPDVGLVASCAMVLSLLSTLYPAAAGASLKAVEALRYE